MGPGVTWILCGKSSQNSPKPVLLLVKVVSYYDWSVLFMSVMGFHTKQLDVGGWGELYPSLFWIFGIV